MLFVNFDSSRFVIYSVDLLCIELIYYIIVATLLGKNGTQFPNQTFSFLNFPLHTYTHMILIR